MSKSVDVTSVLSLLRDDGLVWSADFDVVRLPLADLLESLVPLFESAAVLAEAVASDE